MGLAELPLLVALAGLVLYAALGGADFGAGFWQLVAGRGARGARIREHAHASMAPVWEANHVWLIFVLVVVWTCYPEAFASIASTLALPLLVAAIGIIFRGAAYALRAGTASPRELRAIDAAFAISSVLTPFALGTVVGAIAAGRVPVGNAAGDLVTSWLNPTAIAVGVLAVAFSAYIAAVYLAADAVRGGDAALERAFRTRALAAGLAAGALAAAGLVVLRDDARGLFDELTAGGALAAALLSAAAGAGTLALVWRRRYEPARATAALAVAAVIVAWAIAQAPTFLPGLTVAQAAADDATLVAVLVAVAGGAVVLVPSLALLFALTLRGSLGPGGDGGPPPARRALGPTPAARLARVAGALLAVTLGFLVVGEAGWMHLIGVLALVGAALCAIAAALPLPADGDDGPAQAGRS